MQKEMEEIILRDYFSHGHALYYIILPSKVN